MESTATLAPAADVALDEPTVYRIPEPWFAEFEARFAKLCQRARKLHCDEPTFTVLGTAEHVVTQFDDVEFEVETLVLVTVDGKRPKLAGWEMAAVIDIDHDEPDAPNVVHVVDGHGRPEWRTMAETCDHDACKGAARGRKTLIVVRHEDGRELIVGKRCLADFLGGIGPHQVASRAQWLADVANCANVDDWEGMGPRTENRWALSQVLTITAAAVRLFGWMSKGQAYEQGGGYPTAERVAAVLFGKAEYAQDDDRALRDAAHEPEHRTAGQLAAEWAQALDAEECATNDYLANLQAVTSKKTIRSKDLGIACSALGAYNRHTAQEVARNAVATSSHVGTVGERRVFTGTVRSIRPFENDFGVAAFIKVIDADGNVISWKAAGRCWPHEGDTITGKATIKAHDEFNGTPETVVQRWKWEVVTL